MGLFTELKRRNVFRVGIAYIVGAWLLAQIADLVLDVIGAPDIVLRSVVVVLALGFLPAVIFAWVFEMTPEGVRKESEIDRSQSITGYTAKKLDLVTIVLVIAAVAFVVTERYLPEKATTGSELISQQSPAEEISATGENTPAVLPLADEKSIAVLPFANRSNQEDDLFFTDGIHDDLLTQLAKIHDLNVISRTSVMEYRDTRKNLKEIGSELNVGTILEGGIQKVGNRVRINAQLIEVATDRHLWAETFDRELTAENIFDIQSEIARKIVQAVAVELTPMEEQLLSEVPTQNLAAYEAYLRAREIILNSNYARSREAAAQPWLEKAIALDPEYAEAHARLANIYGQAYWRGIDTSDALVAKLRRAIDTALELNPNSPTALSASANYYYRVENDYRKSLALLRQALENAPGDVDLHGALGLSQRRLGMWQESIASFRKAIELDPASRFYQSLMVETMLSAGEWQDILDSTVTLDDADPDDLDLQIARALAQLNLTGDLEPLERVFEKMNLVDSSQYITQSARVHWLQRDADTAIEVLNNPIWTQGSIDEVFQTNRDYALANAYRLKGETKKAELHYERVIGLQDKVMNSALQVQAYSGMSIALSMARLGRFDEALELAAKLVSDTPPEKDAMLWGWLFTFQAMVKGLAGDQETAIDDLIIAMKTPTAFRVTVWDLHYDPNWDFMRENPRFVELATPSTVIRTMSQ
ncbi:tetratricopeptide repeat protein [Pseudomonadota bacterium]